MSERRARKSLRLPAWDYRAEGAYFITICCHMRSLFLEDANLAATVQRVWDELPLHCQHVALDAFVVMPSHVHGIVWLRAVGAQHAEPLRPGVLSGSLGAVVRSFKATATREARQAGLLGSSPMWQRNYYERVVRDEEELNRIREYIALNPAFWFNDWENPERLADTGSERRWAWLEDRSATLQLNRL